MPVHRFAGEGERLDEQFVGLRAVVVPLAEFRDQIAEFLVGFHPHPGLEFVDLLDAGRVALHEALVARAEDLVQQRADDGDFCGCHGMILHAPNRGWLGLVLGLGDAIAAPGQRRAAMGERKGAGVFSTRAGED